MDRPELPLPPAPETRAVRVSRWLFACSGSATLVLFTGLSSLMLVYGAPYGDLLALVIFPLLATLALGLIYDGYRRANEQAWWTSARIRSQLPLIWQLYSAGNGEGFSPARTRRGVL